MDSILSTETVAPAQRADYWEEMVSQQFVPAHCAPAARAGFSARIRSRAIGALTLCDVRSHGTDVLRTGRHIRESPGQYFLLSLQMRGIGRVEQAGRRVFLHPGDLVLYDTARAYGLSFAAEQQQLVLRLPREALLARSPELESRVGIVIPGQQPAGRLIGDWTRALAALDELPSARSRDSIASALMDLIADSLAARAETGPPGATSARLARAKRVADQGLDDPQFTVARWAAALSISERYLRLLFSASAQSPAQYLWTARLARAAARLREDGTRRQTITEIALDCGFSDSAHFSRAFRAAFGVSPRDYRR